MTTIKDYITAVRILLDQIEKDTDPLSEPGPSFNEISFESLETIASVLARRCRDIATYEKKRRKYLDRSNV